MSNGLQKLPMTSAELAAELALDADALHRIMRAAMNLGFFDLDPRGRFRLNRISCALL